MERLKRLWARVQETAPWHAWKRYGDAKGGLLAAGVAYYGFLSIFPVLALAYAVFGVVLRGHPEWLGGIRTSIDQALPGFVQDESGRGLIALGLPHGGTLATVGVIGAAGLLWSGLGWLDALRDGIRAVFGAQGSLGNVAVQKLRDLAVLVVLGIGVLVSAVVSGFAGGAALWIAGHVGLSGQGWVVTLVGIVVQALLNTGVVALMLRVLAGVDLPWPPLRTGALAGGIALTLLQLFGTKLISGTMSNPVFGSIGLVVGLLVFLDLMSMAILLSAAWAANDLDTARGTVTAPTARTAATPAGRRLPRAARPATSPVGLAERTEAGLPSFGDRTADRTTLAAGAVLGATGAFAVGTLARGIRAVVHRR